MNTQEMKPYVVRRAYKTSAYGMGGWDSNVFSFDAYDEAYSAYTAPMTGKEFRVELLKWEGKQFVAVKARRRKS